MFSFYYLQIPANDTYKNYVGYFQRESPKLEHSCKTEEDDSLSSTIRSLNDEDLLRACGGRTAHK